MRLSFGYIFGAAWFAPAALFAAQPAAPAKAEKAKPAPVVQNYQPKPGLWLLADADTKIYLFGTTHMLPPGFKWRSAALDKIAAEADELVVETYEEPDAEPDVDSIMAMFLEDPKPLTERVPKEHHEALRAAFKKHSIDIDQMAMVRTWMVAVMLGFADELEGWGVDDPKDAPGVEESLEAQFRDAKKPIGSVEEPEAGLEAFNALPEEEQVKLLVETIAPPAEEKAEEEKEAERSDHLWAQGRYEEAYARDMKDMPPVLYDGLVVKRNAAWTEWLKARLEKPGTVLFAVGAAHLAGKDSVQNMLAKSGLDTKRVD
jgi:hypothetical protein